MKSARFTERLNFEKELKSGPPSLLFNKTAIVKLILKNWEFGKHFGVSAPIGIVCMPIPKKDTENTTAVCFTIKAARHAIPHACASVRIK